MISTRQLAPQGDQAIRDLAQRYGVSTDAVRTLLFAVSAGGGTLAQFDHPELGGSGQWMSGGMTMVGDMFNYGLKAKVSGLCAEISSLRGVQQQQGGYAGSLMFTSQYGTLSIDTLKVVSSRSDSASTASSHLSAGTTPAFSATSHGSSTTSQSSEEILKSLERIGDLHHKGILSDEEFKSKKADLLSRL
jgi:hypothetical protein